MTNKRRRLSGVVISDKMDKTVVVRVDSTGRHPLYKKVIKTHAKFMAHDEENICSIGDKVKIAETRPLSKRKRWRVTQILEKTK